MRGVCIEKGARENEERKGNGFRGGRKTVLDEKYEIEKNGS